MWDWSPLPAGVLTDGLAGVLEDWSSVLSATDQGFRKCAFRLAKCFWFHKVACRATGNPFNDPSA